MASTESIRELAEPLLASAGLELWDVEITRDVVRILVDRPAVAASPPRGPAGAGGRPGIDLDALSAASSALSPLLDAHPEVAPEGRYQLEVSSPGVERTLRTPEHFRRYLGAEITVKTSAPLEGARRHRGHLVDVGAEAILLEPEDRPGAHLELRFEQIERARTVLVWGPVSRSSTTGRPIPGRPTPGRSTSGRSTSGRPAPARQPVAGVARAAHDPKDAGS
jgi:ribosome maturation factor RimP